ncbi:hypothetical protein CROQUDRAFT_595905 [Cronartium quercuum f. sp. fusiforme G11]|uniref:Uncharacterized protein n=1 Tax=Cronartium quercuum f. sp. fusiforme G11 TaxID=708437 RepID=A0A9P6NJ12_9BASI|nr:hypothetical protein CROQUDRAFT_595905 [Cronartium quercuum f. sp. fusiforme G11]
MQPKSLEEEIFGVQHEVQELEAEIRSYPFWNQQKTKSLTSSFIGRADQEGYHLFLRRLDAT